MPAVSLLAALQFVLAVGLLAAAVALVVRYRRGAVDRREAALVVALLLAGGGSLAHGTLQSAGLVAQGSLLDWGLDALGLVASLLALYALYHVFGRERDPAAE